MAVFDDWIAQQAAMGNPLAQRWQQHVNSLMADNAQSQQGNIGATIHGGLSASLGTLLGLPMEATANVGKALTGVLGAGVGQATEAVGIHNTALDAMRQAFQGAGGEAPDNNLLDVYNAAIASNEALAGQNRFVSGIYNAILDPLNLVGGPISEAKKAEKLGRLAGAIEKTGGAGRVSGEFVRQGEEEAARAAADAMRTENAKQALGGPKSIDDIISRYDATRGAQPSTLARRQAEEDVQAADVLYKGTQATKRQEAAAAKQDILASVKEGNLAFPDKDTLKQFILQNQEEAKSGVTEGISGLPQRGETWREYMQPHQQALNRSIAEEKQAYAEAQKALATPAVSQATPEQVRQLTGFGKQEEQQLGAMTRANATKVDVSGNLVDAKGKTVLAGVEQPVNAIMNAADSPESAVKAAATKLSSDTALDGSTPAQEPGYLGVMADLVKHAFREGVQAQREAATRQGGRIGLKEAGAIWKGQLVETARNLLMDPVYQRAILYDAGVRERAIRDSEMHVANRLIVGEKNPLQLLGNVSDDLNSVGFELAGPDASAKAQQEFMQRFGVRPFESELDNANNLSALQEMKAEAVGALLNPARAAVSIAAAPMVLARGYLAPMRRRVFRILNTVTHMAARGEVFRSAFRTALNDNAEALLRAAASEGKAVDELVAHADDLGKGLFSPQMVQEVLGDRYAAEWQRMTQQAVESGINYANVVLGNFQERTAAERLLGGAIPLMSWSWRAYPRIANIVLQHPAVASAVIHMAEAERVNTQEEGRPGYQAMTIGIQDDTPLLGVLTHIFSPEQEAEIRVNPLAMLSPIGGSTITIGADTAQQPENAYQAISQGAEALGGSLNPLIQAGAYVAGADYKAPGAYSRYANLDNAANEVTGVETSIPTIQGLLRGARKGVSGKEDTYDVVEAKAKELVYEKTGLPLNDRRNAEYVAQIDAKTGIYKEAERVLDESGAIRTGFNAVTPASVQTNTYTKVAQRQALVNQPWTSQQIYNIKQVSPQLAAEMERENRQYQLARPEAAIGLDAAKPAASLSSADARIAAYLARQRKK